LRGFELQEQLPGFHLLSVVDEDLFDPGVGRGIEVMLFGWKQSCGRMDPQRNRDQTDGDSQEGS
jgi:hypothetical protein